MENVWARACKSALSDLALPFFALLLPCAAGDAVWWPREAW